MSDVSSDRRSNEPQPDELRPLTPARPAHEAPGPIEAAPDNQGPPARVYANHESISLIFYGWLASVLVSVFTTWFASSSRYTSILSTSPVLPPRPSYGLLSIQIAVQVSVLLLRKIFILSANAYRWKLASRRGRGGDNPFIGGICFLDYLVLSKATGGKALLQVIFAKPFLRSAPTGTMDTSTAIFSWGSEGPYFRKRRLLALVRLIVLYVLLFVAQFIMLVQIEPIPTYKVAGNPRQITPDSGFGVDVGTFGPLQDNHSLPFSDPSVWGYLSDTTQVRQVNPLNCSLNSTTPHCSAYVFLGFSNLKIDNPDEPKVGEDEKAAIVIRNVTSYYLQFWTKVPLASNLGVESDWANCTNRTTAGGASLLACLRGGDVSFVNGSIVPNNASAISGNQSLLTAGWHFCYDNKNCSFFLNSTVNENGEGYNTTVFTTTMYIQKVQTTVIVSPQNGTIFDIDMNTTTLRETPVDVQQMFTAFTAPFYYIPVNLSLLLESDYLQNRSVENWLKIFQPIDANASMELADPFVESLIYSFISPLPSESPSQHLRAFLAHALVRNSGFVNATLSQDNASRTYILNITLVGIIVYAICSGITILLSGGMLVHMLVGCEIVPPETRLFVDLDLEVVQDARPVEGGEHDIEMDHLGEDGRRVAQEHEPALVEGNLNENNANEEDVIQILTEDTLINKVKAGTLRDHRIHVIQQENNGWKIVVKIEPTDYG